MPERVIMGCVMPWRSIEVSMESPSSRRETGGGVEGTLDGISCDGFDNGCTNTENFEYIGTV